VSLMVIAARHRSSSLTGFSLNLVATRSPNLSGYQPARLSGPMPARSGGNRSSSASLLATRPNRPLNIWNGETLPWSPSISPGSDSQPRAECAVPSSNAHP